MHGLSFPPVPVVQVFVPVHVPTVQNIPRVLPRPYYDPPLYDLHGLTFSMLPEASQQLLAQHGLDDLRAYDAQRVQRVRKAITDAFMESVRDICSKIASKTSHYHIYLVTHAPDHPIPARLVADVTKDLIPQLVAKLYAFLCLADALVWLDVRARAGGPDALDLAGVLRYRREQNRGPIERVLTEICCTYAHSVRMYTLGWRTDATGALFPMADARLMGVFGYQAFLAAVCAAAQRPGSPPFGDARPAYPPPEYAGDLDMAAFTDAESMPLRSSTPVASSPTPEAPRSPPPRPATPPPPPRALVYATSPLPQSPSRARVKLAMYTPRPASTPIQKSCFAESMLAASLQFGTIPRCRSARRR
ncbi:hypothetical protein B0H15DRAFT_244383 [Mycena belliarum]|uniref:Uncharacterized protein n=1 Tax=Mycena belliarum TaxID=1033014 RepID=A0AAD6XSV0_9AGAR|nr:hypothetical protein B0H15DRAFT_244383 [Mycena belliae]